MWKDKGAATFAVVGKVSMGCLFLEPDGNCNPKYDTLTFLRKTSISAFTVLPSNDEDFVSDLKATLKEK